MNQETLNAYLNVLIGKAEDSKSVNGTSKRLIRQTAKEKLADSDAAKKISNVYTELKSKESLTPQQKLFIDIYEGNDVTPRKEDIKIPKPGDGVDTYDLRKSDDGRYGINIPGGLKLIAEKVQDPKTGVWTAKVWTADNNLGGSVDDEERRKLIQEASKSSSKWWEIYRPNKSLRPYTEIELPDPETDKEAFEEAWTKKVPSFLRGLADERQSKNDVMDTLRAKTYHRSKTGTEKDKNFKEQQVFIRKLVGRDINKLVAQGMNLQGILRLVDKFGGAVDNDTGKIYAHKEDVETPMIMEETPEEEMKRFKAEHARDNWIKDDGTLAKNVHEETRKDKDGNEYTVKVKTLKPEEKRGSLDKGGVRTLNKRKMSEKQEEQTKEHAAKREEKDKKEDIFQKHRQLQSYTNGRKSKEQKEREQKSGLRQAASDLKYMSNKEDSFKPNSALIDALFGPNFQR